MGTGKKEEMGREEDEKGDEEEHGHKPANMFALQLNCTELRGQLATEDQEKHTS